MGTPILMCHGDRDSMVPSRLGWRGAKDLERAGFEAIRFVEYQGLSHQFVPGEWEEVLAFLLRTLPAQGRDATPPAACLPTVAVGCARSPELRHSAFAVPWAETSCLAAAA